MKTSFIFYALFAICTSLVIPPEVKRQFVAKYGDRADTLTCVLCKDVVRDTEKWVGDEEASNEQQQFDTCVQIVNEILPILAQLFCADFVKNELDAIIARLQDADAENQDAQTACTDIGLC